MKASFNKLLEGYQLFRKKYASGDNSIMHYLSYHGQQPQAMIVSCCDSRVDPALILQCEPGDLFVVRNVANIVPPYEKDEKHHGTSAALEFGVCFLKVKHLILLGHSQCGGIHALLESTLRDTAVPENDFIDKWVSVINTKKFEDLHSLDDCAKLALSQSYSNLMTFPWLKQKKDQQALAIHLWFFDVKSGQILTCTDPENAGQYQPLEEC